MTIKPMTNKSLANGCFKLMLEYNIIPKMVNTPATTKCKNIKKVHKV